MESSQNDRKPPGVVVGLDGSAGSVRALAWAATKSSILGPITPILTYRVEVLGDGLGTPAFHTEVSTIMKEDADRRLSAALAAHPELVDRARVIRGTAGRCLIEAAASVGMLVVGCRGRSALTETLLGSVGSYCAKHATVPVAVVPESTTIEPTIDEIVVGIDGSPNSVAALEWALANAAPWGRVTAVACWMPVPLADDAMSLAALEDEARAHLHRAMTGLPSTTVDNPDGEGPTIEARVEFGDARQVLRRLATDADLLVIGARGHRGVPYLLLGSVASALLHHPTATTVVVPNPAGDDIDGAD